MATEDVDPRYDELDQWPLESAVSAMWEAQMAAVAVVHAALPQITAAAEAAAAALGTTGRLVYVGAGTSGRVAVQDGAELPPTFNWPLARIVFAIAGGERALITSVEGAEDDAADGIRMIAEAGVGACDVVIGVAASGTTPFTVAALREATARGAVTIGISSNAGAPLLAEARFAVLIATGGEVVAGSTRMKAGTAQKVALNLISTAIMVRLGRLYRGMMVNMRAANVKLQHRAVDMVMRIAGCPQAVAVRALADSEGEIKLASLIAMGCPRARGVAVLAEADGNLRGAIGLFRAQAE